MLTKLVDYLAALNTIENQWSLYVNPADIDDYRIGQDCFENGGLLDGKVKVATLDRVSFGFQSKLEAIGCFLDNCGNEFVYKGRRVKFNKKDILEAYSDGRLEHSLAKFLEDESVDIQMQWSRDEAELWVSDELPIVLAKREHWLVEMAESLEN